MKARGLAVRSSTRNLAAGTCAMHLHPMRKLVPALALLVAACATTPQPTPTVPQPIQVTPSAHVHSSLLGMSAAELIEHFGSPALQVREGIGVKLQFRSPYCVLDAYLYPPASSAGLTRVTHVDARLASGADTSQAACIAALEGN
jgi:hypothetical protein